MEQLVKILVSNSDGTAQAVHVRESACSGDCHKCSGCGAAKETIFLTVRNGIGARAGDVVRIESASGPVLMGAAVFYVIPMVLFFLGFFLGDSLWNIGVAAGCVGFGLGIGLAVVYDRLVARKQKTEYTVIGYAYKH